MRQENGLPFQWASPLIFIHQKYIQYARKLSKHPNVSYQLNRVQECLS